MVAARDLALRRISKVEMERLDLRRTIYMVRHVDFPFHACAGLVLEIRPISIGAS
jgi:hypothetical protein